jgi:exopolyphosphatase/pppGpp-phosphohydrolase
MKWIGLQAGKPTRRLVIAPQVPPCPTQDAVVRWVSGHLGRVDHERRVAQIATQLFDLTRPLHDLEESDLRMLRFGALIHDVGRSVDKKTHPAQGARLVLADRSLPFSTVERRVLAYLTLYHKGSVPEAGRDEVLSQGDEPGRWRLVLGLLRAADALDSRSLESPRLVFNLSGGSLSRPTLSITCYLSEDSAKARRTYRRRKKFRLLDELLGCRTRVGVASAEALARVA